MFHPSIDDSYSRQKRTFKRLISLWFTLAGMYWLVMYGVEWAGGINEEQIRLLRSGQSVIYFILLTIWGIEYMREVRRQRAVIDVANSEGCAPNVVTAHHVASSAASFSILKPVSFGAPGYLMPLINWTGLFLSLGLIVRQYFSLILMAVN